MKNIKHNKANTFNRDGKAKIVVSISLYNPSRDLTNFNNLVTLKTLKTLDSCGPTFKKLINLFPDSSKIISIKLAQTTKKSN